jgi:hypothetical protein
MVGKKADAPFVVVWVTRLWTVLKSTRMLDELPVDTKMLWLLEEDTVGIGNQWLGCSLFFIILCSDSTRREERPILWASIQNIGDRLEAYCTELFPSCHVTYLTPANEKGTRDDIMKML